MVPRPLRRRNPRLRRTVAIEGQCASSRTRAAPRSVIRASCDRGAPRAGCREGSASALSFHRGHSQTPTRRRSADQGAPGRSPGGSASSSAASPPSSAIGINLYRAAASVGVDGAGARRAHGRAQHAARHHARPARREADAPEAQAEPPSALTDSLRLSVRRAKHEAQARHAALGFRELRYRDRNDVESAAAEHARSFPETRPTR